MFGFISTRNWVSLNRCPGFDHEPPGSAAQVVPRAIPARVTAALNPVLMLSIRRPVRSVVKGDSATSFTCNRAARAVWFIGTVARPFFGPMDGLEGWAPDQDR